MADKDYYQLLGLSKGASAAEIKKAYRKLALEHHPDKNKGDKASEAKFKEVTKAYEVLSDPKKKQAYDQFGHSAFEQGAGQGPFGGAGGPFGGQQGGRQGPFTYTYTQGGNMGGFDFGGFSDPFEIFEQFFGGGGFGRAQRRPTYSISIDFMDAVKGVAKRVNIDGKSQTVKIPAGVDNGQRVRFNTYDVIVEVKQDKKFKREGYDVVTEEEITFPQATLGTEINVETVQGDVKLKIPSGTQPSTIIRLSKKGIPYVNSSNRGDHYVKVKVTIPKNLSSKQKELLREFDGAKKKGWF